MRFCKICSAEQEFPIAMYLYFHNFDYLCTMVRINAIWSYLARHKVVITVVLGLLFVGVIGENSVLAYIEKRMLLSEKEQELERYEEQFTRDSTRLAELTRSRIGVERIARERYFMKRADEDIFVLSTDEKSNDDNH